MKKYAYLCAAAGILSACNGGFDKTNSTFTKQFNAGSFAAAGKTMTDATVTNEEPNNIYLGGLQCDTAFLWANNAESQDICEQAVVKVLKDKKLEDSSYTIRSYEPIMMKTYSAIAKMAAGTTEPAQIFRQTHELQSQNLQDNSKEIAKLKKEYAKEAKGVKGIGNIDSIVKAVSAEMETAEDSVAAFKNYVNPYTTYLAALYNATNGDMTNAPLDFKRVKDFAPKNSYVKSDLDAIKSGKANVWVVFENGTVGELKKRSLAPEVLQNLNIKVTIPDVFPGTPALPSLTVESAGKRVKTEFLANMDQVVKTDQDKYKTQNIISSVTFEVAKVAAATAAKVAAEEVAKKNDNNPWISMAGDVALVGALSVEKPWDLRSWTSLPHEVQVARVAMPSDRKITINDEVTAEIPADFKNAVVFVRVPTMKAKPAVVVGKLN